MAEPVPSSAPAVLRPPIEQALGRLRAARDLLMQATTPRAMSPVARLDWALRADGELQAAERILREAIPYRIV